MLYTMYMRVKVCRPLGQKQITSLAYVDLSKIGICCLYYDYQCSEKSRMTMKVVINHPVGLSEGCGVGKGVYVCTLETAPEGLQPPEVTAVEPNILEIHWSPPKKPNGLITSYHVYR